MLFKDIRRNLHTPKHIEPIKGIEFAEILYADDTFLFGTYTRNISLLLRSIQEESAYYNMKLNLGKCINLTINRKQSNIRFLDDTLFPRSAQAKYLGTLLTDSVDNAAEVTNRIADVRATCAKLRLFWNKAKTSIKWKLKVFNAIIKSKLLYGLDTMQLTEQEQRTLDSVQMKRLRRILGIPPTFVDRTWTNKKVLEKLRDEHNITVGLFSAAWRKKKVKLLGHILRAPKYDPMRQVLFEKGTVVPRVELRKIIGKPKANWLIETYKDAYAMLGGDGTFNIDCNTHTETVKNSALRREAIFSTVQ